jgi:type IV pilus assembly protein PilM
MNFLDTLQKLIPKMGGSRATGNSVVGVDIGSSSIKVVQLRMSRGIAILETYGEIALGPYAKQAIGKVVRLSPEQIATALTDLLKEANVTAREASMSVPFSGTMMTVISVPKVNEETLKRVIPLEARKYIPVAISELTLDWFVIPEEQASTSAFDTISKIAKPANKNQEVLLVAIQNSILQNLQSINTAAQLQVDFYEIEVFSAIRASFVDFGAGSTKVYIVERGIVRLTHLITVGGQHLTEVLEHAMNWEFEKAERIKRETGLLPNPAYSTNENALIQESLLSTLSRIFTEVNRVLLSYGQRYNKNIARVVLLGGGSALPGILDAARGSLRVEVDISHPFAHTEAPAFWDSVLESIGPGFAVPIGLALRKLQQH